MDFSPRLLLDAAENYRGEFVELDSARSVAASQFHIGRTALQRGLRDTLGPLWGERIVVSAANGPAFIATLLALLAEGGCPLLVHPKTPPRELMRTALKRGARLILADDWPIDDLRAEFASVVEIESADWLKLSAVRVDDKQSGFCDDGASLAGVALHPTSGTTGEPKVAVRPAFAALEEARHYIETIGITAADTILAVAPMCHAYAFGMCVMVPLRSGARVVTMRAFQAPRVFEALERQRVSIFPAVPAMLDVLLFGSGERLRRNIRCVLTAGSPLSQRTAERFEAKSGLQPRPLYGTTETGGITVVPSDSRQRAASTVGPPMGGVEARVRIDPSDANAPSAAGRLLIRSSSMMAGYLGKGGIDVSPLIDGWFETGDLATIDGDGEIQLLGRESEMINVEGLKILPGEVEEVIASLPGVVEVKVYAGRRRSGGQFIKAAVVLDPRVDEAAIRTHCEKNLVYYKRPERILSMKALPRSPSGKIVLDQLP